MLECGTMLVHGGRLRAAARRYGIPEAEWLDLSTGINPQGWPVPATPPQMWRCLPQDDDDLHAAAQACYGTSSVLAVAGSQVAIQSLPRLREPGVVAVAAPAYAEHAHAWQQHGHKVISLPSEALLEPGDEVRMVIVINPNNPSGHLFTREALLALHAKLAARGGWLVVDEAFMDATPEQSLASACPLPGLIVLRSLGKFFGLAGARVGFVLAEAQVLHALAVMQGPWPIAAPARFVATTALRDVAWQLHARQALADAAVRLAQVLTQQGLLPAGGCALFQWVRMDDAARLHEQLAQHGILTRLFEQPASVRFGLPADEAQWQRLSRTLAEAQR